MSAEDAAATLDDAAYQGAALREVPIKLGVRVGRTRMPLQSVLNLHTGQLVELDRDVGALVDIVANNDMVIARGEIVEVDEEYGVRIVEFLGDEPARTAS